MGSRGRSIRLRIYFLVAIPLITMLGLFGYVAYTSITNWLNLDRAPTLINATAEPLTNFVNVLQARAPRGGRLPVASEQRQPRRLPAARSRPPRPAWPRSTAALTSAGTKSSSTAGGDGRHRQDDQQPQRPAGLRDGITAKKLAPLDAFADVHRTSSPARAPCCRPRRTASPTRPASMQGLGLISAVNTQEDMSEQDAVLASALVSGSLTGRRPGGLRPGGRTAAGRHAALPAAAHPGRAQDLQHHAERAGARRRCRATSTTIQQAVMAGAPLSEMRAAAA